MQYVKKEAVVVILIDDVNTFLEFKQNMSKTNLNCDLAEYFENKSWNLGHIYNLRQKVYKI